MHRVAIHGDTLSNRVSANAVGRRGRFAKGRFPYHSKSRCPFGKRTERERREALPKAGDGIQEPGQRAASDDRGGVSFSASRQRQNQRYQAKTDSPSHTVRNGTASTRSDRG